MRTIKEIIIERCTSHLGKINDGKNLASPLPWSSRWFENVLLADLYKDHHMDPDYEDERDKAVNELIVEGYLSISGCGKIAPGPVLLS